MIDRMSYGLVIIWFRPLGFPLEFSMRHGFGRFFPSFRKPIACVAGTARLGVTFVVVGDVRSSVT